MHTVLTLRACKRRDAVRLALNQPARPAGAAFGVLSGASSSWPAACGGRRMRKPGHYIGCRHVQLGLLVGGGSVSPRCIDDGARTPSGAEPLISPVGTKRTLAGWPAGG